MADWPRWIDDETVDSSAMCIGYIQWVRSERLNGRETELLPEVKHLPHQAFVDNCSGVNLPWIPCGTVSCDRCTREAGGYKFRWYSHQWQERYMQLKRSGSWVPLLNDANRLFANRQAPTAVQPAANVVQDESP
jgi:hypothetical protein